MAATGKGKGNTAQPQTPDNATNIFESTREQFESRLAELKPFVDEARQIEAFLNLADKAQNTTDVQPQRRRRSGETRRDEFLKVIRENPGIDVAGAAKLMDIAPNYLYRIGPDLVDDGLVTKDSANNYWPVEGAEDPRAQEAEPAAAA